MPSVLIVDDHRNTRESLAIGMTVAGFDAETAASAADAVARAIRREFDAVVSDVRMPDVDGIALGRALRAARPRVLLILMTAYEVTAAESDAVRAIGATLLIKPVTAAALAAYCGARLSERTEVPASMKPIGRS